MEVSDVERRLLWEKGHAMARAHVAFAPIQLQTRLRELEQTTGWGSLFQELKQVAELPTIPTPGAKRLDFIQEEMLKSPLLKRSEELQALRAMLRVDLLNQLERGELLSFAFEPRRDIPGAKRSIHDVPIELSHGHWRGRLEWDKDEIKAQGLHFVEVRILRRDAAAELASPLSAAPSAESQSRKPGRPLLLYQRVEAAIIELSEQGRLDRTKSKASQYPLVLSLLAERYPGMRPPSKETLRTAFNILF